MLFDGDYIFPLSEADGALWYQKKGMQKVYFAPGIYLEKEKQDKYVALVRDIPKENNYRERSCVLRMDIGIEELGTILQMPRPQSRRLLILWNRGEYCSGGIGSAKAGGPGAIRQSSSGFLLQQICR